MSTKYKWKRGGGGVDEHPQVNIFFLSVAVDGQK